MLELQVTSQHQYAEDFIGEPHVFTVQIDDKQSVETAVQNALRAFDDGQVNTPAVMLRLCALLFVWELIAEPYRITRTVADTGESTPPRHPFTLAREAST